MTVSKDIALNVIASIADYERELMKLEGTTQKQARKAALAMGKEFAKAEADAVKRAQENAAKVTAAQGKISAATAQAGENLKGWNQTAQKGTAAAGQLAAAVGLVSPEMGNLVRSGGQAVGAVSAITSSGLASIAVLGPVAAAVGVLALAYHHYAGELEAAEAIQRKAAAGATAAQAAHERFSDMMLDLDVATGRITDSEAKYTRAREQAKLVTDELTKADRERMAVLDSQRNSVGRLAGAQLAEYDRLSESVKSTERRARAWALTQADAGKATTATTAAAKEQDSELMRATASAEAWARAVAVATDGEATVKFKEQLEEIAAIEQKLGADKFDADAAKQLAAERYSETLNKSYADQLEAEQKIADERSANTDKLLAEWDEAVARVMDDIKAEREARVATAKDTLGAIGDTTDALIESGLLTRDQMRIAFAAQKAVGMAEITVSTAQAIMKAAGSLPPPFNAIPIAAMAGLGAAQLAAAAAAQPSFHTGGAIDQRANQPDERTVRVTKNEQIVTHENARKTAAPTVTVVQQFRNRAFDKFVQSNYATGGELYRLTRQGTRVGHRGA